MVKTNRKGRGVLSPQQSQQLIDSIRKIQIGTEGLNKKTVVERAFGETFGANAAQWPIKPHSSTIARYWRHAFPSEKVSLGKKRKQRSVQTLLEDMRTPAAEPQTVVPQVPLEAVFHSCPWCHKPIRALIVAAATVMKHESSS
jgi:hypothetical protein